MDDENIIKYLYCPELQTQDSRGQELYLPGLDAPTKVLGSTLLFAGEYAMTYIYQCSSPNSVSWRSYRNYKRSSYMFKTYGFVGF